METRSDRRHAMRFRREATRTNSARIEKEGDGGIRSRRHPGLGEVRREKGQTIVLGKGEPLLPWPGRPLMTFSHGAGGNVYGAALVSAQGDGQEPVTSTGVAHVKPVTP